MNMTADTSSAQPGRAVHRGPPVQYKDPHEQGWITFSVVMLMVIGVSNIIGGIAAIGDSKFFPGTAKYLVGDLHTLGWFVLLLGVVQVLAGFGVRMQSFAAVWIGVASAGLNLTAQLLFLPAQPLWSLAIAALDAAILFGLVTYANPD
jgi:hypothetical protein